MATRGIQLVRTDDNVSGMVKFYDRRVEDVAKAFIGSVSVQRMLDDASANTISDDAEAQAFMDHPSVKFVIRLAVHGATQNILDASNKLDGDARRDYIAKLASDMQTGLVWASAPVDEASLQKRADDALAKLDPETRAAILAKYAK